MIPKYWFLCLVIYLVTVSPLTGQDSSSHLQLPKSVYGFSLVETSALGGTAGTAYRYKGTAAVSVGQTRVPSQRELNGFLLGQHKDAIAASFAKVLQIDTTSDGWINRSYLLDRPHRAYMSFKFSHGRLDYATSVQVAGDSGTPMVPFVGIVLGSSRQALLSASATQRALSIRTTLIPISTHTRVPTTRSRSMLTAWCQASRSSVRMGLTRCQLSRHPLWTHWRSRSRGGAKRRCSIWRRMSRSIEE